jgi:hypothetical protein
MTLSDIFTVIPLVMRLYSLYNEITLRFHLRQIIQTRCEQTADKLPAVFWNGQKWLHERNGDHTPNPRLVKC